MKEPKDGEWYNWDAFIRWAEKEAVASEHKEDWEPWWECWKAGYISAMNG